MHDLRVFVVCAHKRHLSRLQSRNCLLRWSLSLSVLCCWFMFSLCLKICDIWCFSFIPRVIKTPLQFPLSLLSQFISLNFLLTYTTHRGKGTHAVDNKYTAANRHQPNTPCNQHWDQEIKPYRDPRMTVAWALPPCQRRLAPTISNSTAWLSLFAPSVKGITWCVFPYVAFLLNIMFAKFIRIISSDCTTGIHSTLLGIWVVSSCKFLWIVLLWPC